MEPVVAGTGIGSGIPDSGQLGRSLEAICWCLCTWGWPTLPHPFPLPPSIKLIARNSNNCSFKIRLPFKFRVQQIGEKWPLGASVISSSAGEWQFMAISGANTSRVRFGNIRPGPGLPNPIAFRLRARETQWIGFSRHGTVWLPNPIPTVSTALWGSATSSHCPFGLLNPILNPFHGWIKVQLQLQVIGIFIGCWTLASLFSRLDVVQQPNGPVIWGCWTQSEPKSNHLIASDGCRTRRA